MNELRIYGHSPAALVACSVFALLGCRQDPGDGGGEDADAPEQDPPMAEDGDGDGDPGDAEPVCDLSQFPRLHPEWIAEVEGPIEGETPTVASLAVSEDALFVSASNNLSGTSTGALERRSLSGELEWALELESPHLIVWADEYLYGAGRGKLRRWTADGVEDAWVHDAKDYYGWGSAIADIAVDGNSVAVVGHFYEPDGYGEAWSDAFYAVMSKTAPPVVYESGAHAIMGTTDYGDGVVRSPWGGWIAGGVVDHPDQVWLRGFGGSTFSADLRPYKFPQMHTMIPHEDLLLVFGRSSSAPSGAWMAAMSSSGEELWHRPLWVCEGVGASLDEFVERDGELWGLGAVRSAPKTYTPMLVRMSFEGAVEQVYVIDSEPVSVVIMYDLATDGTALYFGGVWFPKVPGRRVIGKVNP